MILYIVFGVIGGVFGGLGMGGGTLLIPLLTQFTGVGQHVAQMVNLIAFIPMSVVVLFIHIKSGLVKFRYLLLVSLPAVLFSVVASMVTSGIEGEFLGKCFGVFLIVLGLLQLVSIIRKNIIGRCSVKGEHK